MSKYIPKNIYDDMKKQSRATGVNDYKANYYHESVSSRYTKNVLFTVNNIPGSDWREKGMHCFKKCTDKGDDCRILTFKKDSSNVPVTCWGMGIDGYKSRDVKSTAKNHSSYHKRTP